MLRSLVGSEMCIRDSHDTVPLRHEPLRFRCEQCPRTIDQTKLPQNRRHSGICPGNWSDHHVCGLNQALCRSRCGFRCHHEQHGHHPTPVPAD
eukprot:TRINITY_DN59368_c0_g1_i1.p1 TRINITY_DN59368_c0_g1~~TRINITY_DN59368_c0_g1_i1.p1  ORF type:complete len:105 (-),score=21.13 TRINITY_DN59368_c0_g1_i1:61-339(-)